MSFCCQQGEQKSGIKIVAWVWSGSHTFVMFNVSQTEWHQGHRSFPFCGKVAGGWWVCRGSVAHHHYQHQHQHHMMGPGLTAWASFWISVVFENHKILRKLDGGSGTRLLKSSSVRNTESATKFKMADFLVGGAYRSKRLSTIFFFQPVVEGGLCGCF